METTIIKKCIYCNNIFTPRSCNKYTQKSCGSLECKKKLKRDYDHINDKTEIRKEKRKNNRIKYYSDINIREKWDKYQKEYRSKYYNIPEKRERILERSRKNFQIPEKRHKKIQKIKEYKKTLNGRLIQRISNHKRRSNMNNIIQAFSKNEWEEKLIRSNGICIRCNRYIGIYNLTIDHIYSIYLASEDFKRTGIKRVYTIDDVQPLCRICNAKKNKYLDYTNPKGLNTSDLLNK